MRGPLVGASGWQATCHPVPPTITTRGRSLQRIDPSRKGRALIYRVVGACLCSMPLALADFVITNPAA